MSVTKAVSTWSVPTSHTHHNHIMRSNVARAMEVFNYVDWKTLFVGHGLTDGGVQLV
jgi:hypothetical protein